MNFAFRFDLGPGVGLGHYSRCESIINILNDHGHSVYVFVGGVAPLDYYPDIKNSKKLYVIKNYELTKVQQATHFSRNEDANEVLYHIKKDNLKIDWMVVDHYQLDTKWQKLIRNTGIKTLVIDDEIINQHTPDIYLNYNKSTLTKHEAAYVAAKKYLLGLKFMPLNKSYNVSKVKTVNSDYVRRIHLFFGASDTADYTHRILNTIREITDKHSIFLDVVISSSYQGSILPSRTSFRNLSFLINPDSLLPSLMKSDIAIGAGGISCLERCSIGIPSINICAAENQRNTLEMLNNNKAIRFIDPKSIDWEENLCQHLLDLIENKAAREQCTRACLGLNLSQGSDLIIDEMLNFHD